MPRTRSTCAGATYGAAAGGDADVSAPGPASVQHVAGQCHCGNLHYRLVWPDGPARPPAAYDCQCDFCRRHGAAWFAHAAARLDAAIAVPDALIAYRLARARASFQICAQCGILVWVSADEAPLAMLNVRTVASLDPDRWPSRDAGADDAPVHVPAAQRSQLWMPIRYGPVTA